MLLTEGEIAAGMRHAYVQEGEILEGSAAVGIAALLSGKVGDSGARRDCAFRAYVGMKLHHSVINDADDPFGKDASCRTSRF